MDVSQQQVIISPADSDTKMGLRHKTQDVVQLGEGSRAKVFELKRKNGQTPIALKVLKEATTPADLMEVEVARHMHHLGIGPEVYDVTLKPRLAIQMEMVDTIEHQGHFLNDTFAAEIVDLVIRMVDNGYVHNDLHVGNIAQSRSTKRALLIDFGLVQEIEKVSGTVRAQIILAQLYALVDPCNVNNVRSKFITQNTRLNKWISSSCNNSIGTAIYAIRNGKIPVESVDPEFWKTQKRPRQTKRKGRHLCTMSG